MAADRIARPARSFITTALFTHRYFTHIALLLLLFEIALNYTIIQRVPYTEIDWHAYMQQVHGVISSGELNYRNLKGGTGPLVYPAGFVWIYSVLYTLTDGGSDIRTAQYVFMALYLATFVLIAALCKRVSRFPPVLLSILALSKRLHSIYVLRLFNDPFAMAFAFAAVYCMVSPSRTVRGLAGVLFGLAISVKMNVLLMLPGAAYIWFVSGGVAHTLRQLLAVCAVQATVGAPFIAAYPREYFARAYEFSRVFTYTWTVNWRFVDEATFLSPRFAGSLIAGHLAVLAAFAVAVWPRWFGSRVARIVAAGIRCRPSARMGPEGVIAVVFTSNLVGVLFARSLHYQFYAWYCHTLPLLLCATRVSVSVQLVVWGVVEWCWNVYPATPLSSGLLCAAHVAILVRLAYVGSMGGQIEGVQNGRRGVAQRAKGE